MSRVLNANNCTLDTFRSVLGKVNDGNVMPECDKDMHVVGIHKANYGFFNRGAEADNGLSNSAVRNAFYQAIEKSDLTIPARVLTDIRMRLGLGPGAAEGVVRTKLMRTEVKSILDLLDSEAAKFAADTAKTMALDESMSNILLCDLSSRDRMLLFKARSQIETAVQLTDIDRQMGLLPPKGFLGHSAAEMRTFLKSHGPEVAARLFENLFWETRTDKCQSEAEIGRSLTDRLLGGTRFAEAFQKAAREVMESFAKENPKPLTTAKDRYIAMSGFPDGVFFSPEDTVLAKDEKNPAKCERVKAFKNDHEPFFGSFDQLLGLMEEAGKKDSVSSVEVYQARTALLQLRDNMYTVFLANGNHESNLAAMSLVQDILHDLKNYVAPPEQGVKALAQLFAGGQSPFEMFPGDSNVSSYDQLKSTYDRLKSAFEAFRKTYDTRGCVREIIEAYCEKDPVLKDDKVLAQEFFQKIEHDLGSDKPVDKDSPVWNLKRDVDALSRTLFKKNGLYEDTLSVRKQEGILVDNIRDEVTALAGSFLQGAKEANEKRQEAVLQICQDAVGLADDLKLKGDNPQHEGLLRLAGVFVGAAAAEQMDDDHLLACLMKVDRNLLDLAVKYLKAGLDGLDGEIESKTAMPNVFRNMVFDGQLDPASLSPKAVKEFLPLLVKASVAAVEEKRYSTTKWFEVFNPVPPPALDKLSLDEAKVQVKAYLDCFAPLQERLRSLDPGSAQTLEEAFAAVESSIEGDDKDALAMSFSLVPSLISNLTSQFHLAGLHGFPTTNMAEVMQLLSSCGLTGTVLDTFEGREKVTILMRCAMLNPHGMKGLKDYCETVFGKPFDNLTLTDLGNLGKIPAYSPDTQIQDKGQLATWRFLSGRLSLAELKVSGESALALAKAAQELEKPGVKSVEVAGFNGSSFSLQKAEDGSLVAVLKGVTLKIGQKNEKRSLRIPVAIDLKGLRQSAENELIARAREFRKEVLDLLEGLSDPPLPGTVERSREMCVKTIRAFKDVPDVVFSGLTASALRRMAVEFLSGREPVLDPGPNDQYMSSTAVELHRSLGEYKLENPGQLRTIVHLPSASGVRTLAQRNEKTEPEDVRNLIADLFMNADTWNLDEAALGGHRPQGGERLQRLLRTYGPELTHLGEAGLEEYLADLPDVVRDEVRGVLEQIIGLKRDDPLFTQDASLAALAQIDDSLATIADRVMVKMQKTITDDYFKAKAPDQRPVTEKTFAELAGGEGLNLQTTSGRFAKTVLDGYFSHAKTMDKRKWLSAFVLNTKKGDSMNRQVAELLKGAGPLLQKILQGLPIESFNVETQEALKDMKSRLPPIPEEAVRAQMLECVRASGGKILSIEVKKSLGAASVAQAFLCNIKTPEHPVTGVDCVIKVLRPTAAPAIGREKAVIDELLAASKDPMIGAIKADFESHYASVLEELDFTLEAQNVDLGVANYDQPTLNFGGGETLRCNHVHSMHRVTGLTASPGAMVVELAPGETMDRYIESIDGKLDGILRVGQPEPVKVVTAANPGGPQTTDYVAKDFRDLLALRSDIDTHKQELLSRRDMLNELVKAWFDRALFGDGFFHGDMHAGNVMIDGNGVTVIDFGNCTRMSRDDRDRMLALFIAAVSGDAEQFLADLGVVKPGADLVNEIADVFAKGNGLSALERIEGAFTVLQGRNMTIPSVCSSFISSLTRLNGIISALDAKIQRCDDIKESLHIQEVAPQGPGEVERPGQPTGVFSALSRVFTIRPVTGAHIKEALAPYVDDSYDFFAECGGDLSQIVTQLEKLITTFAVLGESTAAVEEKSVHQAIVCVKNNLKQILDNPDSTTYVNRDGVTKELFEPDLEDEKSLDDPGAAANANQADKAKEPPARKKPSKEECLARIKDIVSKTFRRGVVGGLTSRFSDYESDESKTLEGQGTFSDQIGEVIENRSKDCMDFLMRKFNEKTAFGLAVSRKGSSYAQKMLIGTEKGVKDSVREAAALKRMRALNDGKPVAEQVSSQDVTIIRKTIKDFYAPQTCVYRSTKSNAILAFQTVTITDSPVRNWGANAENRKTFLKALDYNMMRLEKSFGGALQEKHWKFAFALYSGCETSVFEASMIGAVKNMSAQDYNALLAEAQQSGGNYNPQLVSVLDFMREYAKPSVGQGS